MNLSYALHGHDHNTTKPHQAGYTLQHDWI